MSLGLDDRRYSSRDVQDSTGLSPRQQNDWDGRDLLPHDRDGKEGWRRFTPREIFALMVCTEIRRQYGTPVRQLKWVQNFMLKEGANHFEAAVKLMDLLGVGVWLCTDLEETFVLDSELEIIDMWEHGYFGAGCERAFVFLPINPLVNRLLSCLKEPIELEAHGKGYEIMQAVRTMHTARTPEEVMVLNMIRNEEIKTVEIESPTGSVETIRTTAKVDPLTRFSELLGEPFQRLTVTKKDGRVVSIEQEVTTKPKKVAR